MLNPKKLLVNMIRVLLQLRLGRVLLFESPPALTHHYRSLGHFRRLPQRLLLVFRVCDHYGFGGKFELLYDSQVFRVFCILLPLLIL